MRRLLRTLLLLGGASLASGCWNFSDDLRVCQQHDRCVEPPKAFTLVQLFPGVELNAIWGRSETQLYAVGARGRLLEGNGQSFAVNPSFSTTTTADCYGLFGRGTDELYVTGQSSTLQHWNGGRWTSEAPAGVDLFSIWGEASPTGDVYAVGSPSSGTGGIIYRHTGTGWAKELDTPTRLLGVWHDGVRAWAVGINGQILQRDGASWTSMSGATDVSLNAIWGAAPDDLWAVGTYGAALHWNGSQWTATQTGTSTPLLGVWGNAPDNVWASGQAGLVLQWNGRVWRQHPTTITEHLYGDWVSPTGTVWLAGSAGGIYRSDAK